VAREVLERGNWPGWTNLIAWPHGGALYFIDTFNALFTLPVQLLLGPVVTQNLIIGGALWFTALSGWALARHVVRDDLAALPAGIIFGFSPHLLSQAHNGITEALNAGWFALFLLSFLRLLDAPSPRRGALCGITLVLTSLFNWYYAIFAILSASILLGARVLDAAVPTAWRRVLRASLVGLGLFIPLAGGGLFLLGRSMSAGDALVSRDPEFVWRSLLQHNYTDIQCFFRPGRFYSPDLKALYGEELLIVTYIGWVALLIAGVGFLVERHRKDLWPWVWLALLFWVFALGPFLNVGGEYVEVSGRRIPLPFLAFFDLVPLFSRISHPFRFVVGVEVCLGIGVAMALRRLTLVRPTLFSRVATGVVGLAVLAETIFASPAPLPVASSIAQIPDAYGFVKADPEPGAVLDLPIAVPLLERAVYNWYQVFHERPIPYTLNEPVPPGLRNNLLASYMLALEAGRARIPPRTIPDLELVMASRILARQGYRYVVVHGRFYPEVKRVQVHSLLGALFGPPVAEDDASTTVYRIP
jgi:hypothetical protein